MGDREVFRRAKEDSRDIVFLGNACVNSLSYPLTSYPLTSYLLTPFFSIGVLELVVLFKKIISNGARVLVDPCPWFRSVALVVSLEGGLSDETESQVGISHLLEHLLFKRTGKRSTRDLAIQMDEFGGEINAYTESSRISLYGVVPATRLNELLEFFAELIVDSRFDEPDLAVEKEIIRQEILEANDSPSEITYQALCKILWPNSIFRFPVFGSVDSVSRISTKDLRARLKTISCGKRLTVAVVGNVEAEEFSQAAERHFGNLPEGVWERPRVENISCGHVLAAHPVTQVHLALCQQFPSIADPDYLESLMFTGIFGDGLSSRLFQLLREEKGIAYDVSAHVEAMSDQNLFVTSAVLERENVEEALSLILSELRKVRQDSISEAELARMKKYVSAQLEMEYDSLSSRLWRLLEGETYLGRYVGVEEVLERAGAITIESISKFIEQRISFSGSALALGGNVKGISLSEEMKAFCGFAN